MKTSHRIAAIAIREARRFASIAAMRASRETDQAKMARSAASFRPLTEAETEALWARTPGGLIGVRRHA